MQAAAIPWSVDEFGGGLNTHTITMLRDRNPIPVLDNGFRFDDSIDPETGEKRHDYYITDSQGERKYKGSCTGIIAEYTPPFDPVAAYKGMVEKGRIADPADQYFGMTLEQCIEEWRDIGEKASGYGSLVHAEIEKFLNNACAWYKDPLWNTDENTRPALLRFMKFFREFIVRRGIIPLRTELVLHNEEYEFAGSIDFVGQKREWRDDPERRNWVVLMDWKRSKKILKSERVYEKMIGVCSSLDECSLSHYRLQLTLYALILMSRTSYIVKELYVVAFHGVHASYDLIPIEPLYDIARKMLVERRQRLLCKYSTQLCKMLEDNPEASLVARNLHGLLKSQFVFGASAEAIMGQDPTERKDLKRKLEI
jgi:hypothetical protein